MSKHTRLAFKNKVDFLSFTQIQNFRVLFSLLLFKHVYLKPLQLFLCYLRFARFLLIVRHVCSTLVSSPQPCFHVPSHWPNWARALHGGWTWMWRQWLQIESFSSRNEGIVSGTFVTDHVVFPISKAVSRETAGICLTISWLELFGFTYIFNSLSI